MFLLTAVQVETHALVKVELNDAQKIHNFPSFQGLEPEIRHQQVTVGMYCYCGLQQWYYSDQANASASNIPSSWNITIKLNRVSLCRNQPFLHDVTLSLYYLSVYLDSTLPSLNEDNGGVLIPQNKHRHIMSDPPPTPQKVTQDSSSFIS